MFLLKAGFEEVHFTHQLCINRTLFFETGISDRQKTVLNGKPWSVEEFGKTIVLSNRIRPRIEGSENQMSDFMQQTIRFLCK
jgi:hypothetical protein